MHRFFLFASTTLCLLMGSALFAEEKGECEEDMPEEFREEIVGAAPDQCDCGECYQKICRYEKCHYEEWMCVTKEVTYEKKNRRYIPQYYEKLRCKYVPQYYYETYVRYIPEYYTTYDTYTVPEYKLVSKCKEVPKYYFKKRENCGCCGQEGSNPETQSDCVEAID